MSEYAPLLNSELIMSDELPTAQIEAICREISARYAGEILGLSEFATKESEALRRGHEDPRPIQIYPIVENPFEHDARRALFAKAFERLGRKTQVCTGPISDHVTNRQLHSVRMAGLAESAAFALGLNQQLTKAIAYPHDFGHAPLGHRGEPIVTASIKSVRNDALKVLGVFKHNIQSLHVVDRVEGRTGYPKGTGLNLTDQVRHGILSHDGEKDVVESQPNETLRSDPGKIQDDIRDYTQMVIAASGVEDDPETAFSYVNKNVGLKTATMEASLVQLFDVLHAVPEDFEDMITLGVIKRESLSTDIAQVLGNDSASMINRLITDLLVHSYGTNKIRYSKRVGEALNKLKRQVLYPLYMAVNAWVTKVNPDTRVRLHSPDLQERMNFLFHSYMEALVAPNKHSDSPMLKFLQDRDLVSHYKKIWETYPGTIKDAELTNLAMVVDFVAGFTDDFFFAQSDNMHT